MKFIYQSKLYMEYIYEYEIYESDNLVSKRFSIFLPIITKLSKTRYTSCKFVV